MSVPGPLYGSQRTTFGESVLFLMAQVIGFGACNNDWSSQF